MTSPPNPAPVRYFVREHAYIDGPADRRYRTFTEALNVALNLYGTPHGRIACRSLCTGCDRFRADPADTSPACTECRTHAEYRARHVLPPAPRASTSTERAGRAHGAAGYAPRHSSDAYLTGYRAGCASLPGVATLPEPPDGGDYLFCCEWVAIPHPGESTACTYCGSTFARSLPSPDNR